MDGTTTEIPKIAPFHKSTSFINKLSDFTYKKFTGEQAWGSTSLLLQMVFSRGWQINAGLERTGSAQTVQKDWSRVASGALALGADGRYFISGREGNQPKGENALSRMIYTARHPEECSVHARILYSVPSMIAATIGDLYFGYGPAGVPAEKTKRPRAALNSAILTGLQLWSLFKDPKKETDPRTEHETKRPESGVKARFHRSLSKMEHSNIAPFRWLGFALHHQQPLLVAYVLELLILADRFGEGAGKKQVAVTPEAIKEANRLMQRSVFVTGITTSNFFYNINRLSAAEAKAHTLAGAGSSRFI